MTEQLTLAMQLRDIGIQRAVEHADAEIPSWSDIAFDNLRMFLRYAPDSQFMGEDVRGYATTRGLPDPPDKRAWGAVMLRAARAGLIRKIGYAHAKDPKVHRSINPLWERVG